MRMSMRISWADGRLAYAFIMRAAACSCLAMVGGCAGGSGADSVISGISQGLANIAAHLTEAFLLNLFV